jgi:hypothetical protein
MKTPLRGQAINASGSCALTTAFQHIRLISDNANWLNSGSS